MHILLPANQSGELNSGPVLGGMQSNGTSADQSGSDAFVQLLRDSMHALDGDNPATSLNPEESLALTEGLFNFLSSQINGLNGNFAADLEDGSGEGLPALVQQLFGDIPGSMEQLGSLQASLSETELTQLYDQLYGVINGDAMSEQELDDLSASLVAVLGLPKEPSQQLQVKVKDALQSVPTMLASDSEQKINLPQSLGLLPKVGEGISASVQSDLDVGQQFESLLNKSAMQFNSGMLEPDDASVDGVKLDSLKGSFAEIQSKMLKGSDKLYSTTVNSNVFDAQWKDDISEKIVWMTAREIKSAEIHLNPAELGPIDLKVTVQNDTATVNINAQNSTVREMLESQVVRLREMMEQNGVALDDVNVGGGEQEQAQFAQNGDEEGHTGSGSNNDGDSDQGDVLDSSQQETLSSNLVDFYA